MQLDVLVAELIRLLPRRRSRSTRRSRDRRGARGPHLRVHPRGRARGRAATSCRTRSPSPSTTWSSATTRSCSRSTRTSSSSATARRASSSARARGSRRSATRARAQIEPLVGKQVFLSPPREGRQGLAARPEAARPTRLLTRRRLIRRDGRAGAPRAVPWTGVPPMLRAQSVTDVVIAVALGRSCCSPRRWASDARRLRRLVVGLTARPRAPAALAGLALAVAWVVAVFADGDRPATRACRTSRSAGCCTRQPRTAAGASGWPARSRRSSGASSARSTSSFAGTPVSVPRRSPADRRREESLRSSSSSSRVGPRPAAAAVARRPRRPRTPAQSRG